MQLLNWFDLPCPDSAYTEFLSGKQTWMNKENKTVSKLPAPPVAKNLLADSQRKRKLEETTIEQTSQPVTNSTVKREIAPVRKPTAVKTRVGTVAGKTAVPKTITGRPPLSRSEAAKKPITNTVNKPIMPPKKRPAYDVKGRLQDLEQHFEETNSKLGESTMLIETMTKKLDKSDSTSKFALIVSELINFKSGLEQQVVKKQLEVSEMEKELELLRSQKKSSQSELKTEIEGLKKLLMDERNDFESKIKVLERDMEELKLELQSSKSEIATYKVTISTQAAVQFQLESEISILKSKLSTQNDVVQDQSTVIESREKEILDLKTIVEESKQKIFEHEEMRKKLHNEIQELKGNIRVFCRVRPQLNEEVRSEESKMVVLDEKPNVIELVQSLESASGNKLSKSYPFQFDKVFDSKSKQSEVFEEISQLVQSALDGYNISIFAYGQTGSGKTYTMQGPENIMGADAGSDDSGMIPRAVEQIFECVEKLKEHKWSYEMEAQYLEIYNETLRDLLTKSNNSNEKYDIKHDAATSKTIVTNAKVIKVSSPTQIYDLLKTASENRAVAATACNERSSRSHSVFSLRLQGYNNATEETRFGVLNLIDLAGSERLAQSKAAGDRLKETQNINKSLSALGDVIAALSNKENHIPYRNSKVYNINKLTYLLQNSLGGNSKTLMFVNVSPSADSFNESLCSLRFATKVDNFNLGEQLPDWHCKEANLVQITKIILIRTFKTRSPILRYLQFVAPQMNLDFVS